MCSCSALAPAYKRLVASRPAWPRATSKVAPAVKKLYEAGQQSTRQLMNYFQIDSCRTLYKILRFAGC